ncbi:hypothetical protein [Phenylobacterium sp.]|uniref:hypothetical protein n=1 Tax=Phenylobacterium sp. TaxID=1871053 RepID=UPI00301D9971
MRDLYRNRNGAAGHFHGGAIPARHGGGSSSAKDLGWTRYGPLDQINYGTSSYTKAILGPTLVGGTFSDWVGGEDRR